jgi:hypothetical protein
MKARALLLPATLLLGCSDPPAAQDAEALEVKAPVEIAKAETTPAPPKPEPAPEVKPEPPPKPKPKPLNESRCRKLLYQFDQCGWRCTGRGGNPGQCVNVCRPLLNPTKMKCLRMWGPGFG